MSSFPLIDELDPFDRTALCEYIEAQCAEIATTAAALARHQVLRKVACARLAELLFRETTDRQMVHGGVLYRAHADRKGVERIKLGPATQAGGA